MLSSSLLTLVAAAGLTEASLFREARQPVNHLRLRAVDNSTLTLLSNAIQKGSFNDGSDEIGANEANQAKSQTSQNNFINNCSGKTLTNGLQILTGSCNGIPMGDIPAKANMVSSVITFPVQGSADIESETTFNITVQMSNIAAGTFTNADANYYSAPQQLSANGLVIGHTHVTVQDLGVTLNPTVPLDATQFAFFKGINDAGNGQGLLSATVTGGLPAGNYRVCTIAAAANHQPVLMPVAQRGSPDDCTKFTVIGTGTFGNSAANDGAGGEAAAAAAASAVAVGPNFDAEGTSTTAVAITTSGAVLSTTAAASTTDAASTTAAAITTTAASNATISAATTTTSAAAITTAAASNATVSGFFNTTISAASTTTSAVTDLTTAAVTDTTTSAGTDTTTSAASSSTTAATHHRGGNGGKGGKGGNNGNNGGEDVITKEIISIIETFFEFVGTAVGGAVPPVGKSGNQFAVYDELFDDLSAAAAASCGHQFTACQSLAGPGFSIEECVTQQDTCTSAAASQTTTATAPQTVTATQVLPVTATASVGSAIATKTVTTAAAVTTTTTTSAAPVATTTSKAAVVTSSKAAVDAVTTSKAAAQSTSAAAAIGGGDAPSLCLVSVVTVTATVHDAAPTS